MQTMTLCTLGVFSTVRKSASVPMSMPSSASARARVLEQALLEGGIDPGARHHLGAQRRRAAVHQVDLAAAISCAVSTPFSISSERTASSSTS